MKHIIRIAPDGTSTAIYSDALQPLLPPDAHIRRASYVEPMTTVKSDGWCADLGPIGGPLLGPYLTRAEALAAEANWISQHVLGGVV